jgi:hypothetical protein
MKEMAREGCLGYVVVSLKNENRAVEMGGGGGYPSTLLPHRAYGKIFDDDVAILFSSLDISSTILY